MDRDAENSYLSGEAVDDDPMMQLPGHSATCRITVRPQAGRKVFTLRMLPSSDQRFGDGIDQTAGFVPEGNL